MKAGQTESRFFEASWMHKYNGKYYFSYSTGDTHLLCYAIGDNPYGPFTYQGVILTPVVGWTTHHGSGFKARDGKLYFGGINGVTAFYPKEVSHSRKVPDVYISNFYVFNKPVNVGLETGKMARFDKAVPYAKEVRIHQSNNVFSIEFICLEFTHPQSITYKYKMEGFDKEWKETGADNRLVTYTNLPHGTYTFKVQAYSTDQNGSYSETELAIVILPPWWQSVWAYIVYLIMLIAVGRRMYARLQKRIKDRRQQLEREHTEQIKEAKLRFFTNISHVG